MAPPKKEEDRFLSPNGLRLRRSVDTLCFGCKERRRPLPAQLREVTSARLVYGGARLAVLVAEPAQSQYTDSLQFPIVIQSVSG